MAADSRGPTLLRLARTALEEAVAGASPADAPNELWLDETGASFVTLRTPAGLRGCIGTIHPRRSLAEDVRSNARAAALRDTRFPPLHRDELDRVTLEVSLLSPLESLDVADEDELLAALRPQRDGLYLEAGFHRATFLPQVWSSLPQPVDFVRKLRLKAGLAADAWPPEIRWWRFTVECFEEPEPR